MNIQLSFFLVLLLCGCGHSSVSQVYSAYNGNVVKINALTSSGNLFADNSTGTGIIINNNGYIVTSRHLVTDNKIIDVILSNGRKVYGNLIGIDKIYDMAIVKIDNELSDQVKKIDWVDENEVVVGEEVFSISNQFNLGLSLSKGIVGLLHYNVTFKSGINLYDAIQMDMTLNPGSSGAPVFSSNGKLLGIVSNVVRFNEGPTVSFAIDGRRIKNRVAEIIQYGKIREAKIGIETQPVEVSVENTSMNGLQILSIKSRKDILDYLKVGDVLLRINNIDVSSHKNIDEILSRLTVGDQIDLAVLSGNSIFTRSIRLIEKN